MMKAQAGPTEYMFGARGFVVFQPPAFSQSIWVPHPIFRPVGYVWMVETYGNLSISGHGGRVVDAKRNVH